MSDVYVLWSSFVHTSAENPNVSTNVDAVLSYSVPQTNIYKPFSWACLHLEDSEVVFYVYSHRFKM